MTGCFTPFNSGLLEVFDQRILLEEGGKNDPNLSP